MRGSYYARSTTAGRSAPEHLARPARVRKLDVLVFRDAGEKLIDGGLPQRPRGVLPAAFGLDGLGPQRQIRRQIL